jgi:uncharacterized membrane protein YfcA
VNKLQRYGKVILFDTLAVFCFIGVILFGWLPGPGGLPLFLAGLALLAVNHDWAERWLETAKYKSKSFKKILFPNTPWVRHLYDFVSVVLFVGSGYLFFTTLNNPLRVGSMTIASFSLFVFLVNRERIDKLSSLFKRKKA